MNQITNEISTKTLTMKNYFSFDLTGKKFFPVWLAFYICYIVPYAFLIIKTKSDDSGISSPGIYLMSIAVVLVIAFLISFFIMKLVIEHFSYNNKPLVFNGKFGDFVGIVLAGILLTVITLGIYAAWFAKDLTQFFIDNSKYESNSLKFRGKGDKLFVILLLTIFLPIMAFAIITTVYLLKNSEQQISLTLTIIQQIVTLIIMIPYLYYIYKWAVNIGYKNYRITWETKFWNSCGKIALEMFLSVVTLGIYMPMASLKLYSYFIEKTIAKSPEARRRFGFERDNVPDFLFIWGQTLLTIVTAGFYFPWSFSKIGSRLLGRTYLSVE